VAHHNSFKKIIEHLTKDEEDKKVERLSNLGHLFNLFTDIGHRYSLLTVILEYALASEQTSAVEGQFDTIDHKLRELNASSFQKRKIYEIVLKHIRDWRSNYVYDFWVKYLSAYDENEPIPNDVKEEANSFILTVIKDLEIMRMDQLLASYVVKSFKNDKKFAKTYRLLEIFTCKGYKEYMDFHRKNEEYIANSGLKHDDLVTKIRLLTLMSLASSQHIILYSEVSKILEVDESDVEFIVVEAITSEILDARIDQLNRRIVVRHAESRVFGEEEWKRLDTKIQKWKDNMTNLLTVVQTAKGVNGGAST